jgi:hypothetical protein
VKKYKVYSSLFQAVNPFTGKLKIYKGANIISKTFREAQQAVQILEMEYLVIDEIISEGNYLICLN